MGWLAFFIYWGISTFISVALIRRLFRVGWMKDGEIQEGILIVLALCPFVNIMFSVLSTLTELGGKVNFIGRTYKMVRGPLPKEG